MNARISVDLRAALALVLCPAAVTEQNDEMKFRDQRAVNAGYSSAVPLGREKISNPRRSSTANGVWIR